MVPDSPLKKKSKSSAQARVQNMIAQLPTPMEGHIINRRNNLMRGIINMRNNIMRERGNIN